MKKLITTISLLAIIALMMSGCGASGGVGTSGATSTSGTTLCTDEEILSKLKNDDSPEFVLDGEYYSLPITANTLIDHGWDMTIDEYKGQEVILQSEERVYVTFSKDENTVSAILVNDSQLPLEPENSNVIQVSISASETKQTDFLVTKYGITGTTSAKDAKAVLQEKEGYSESSIGYRLTSNGELGARDILYFSNNNGHTVIRIASAEEWPYSLYKPLEQKAQEQADKIAEYKKDAEQNCPKNYDDIVKSLAEATSLNTVPFYSIDGTIVAKGTGKYEGMEDDLVFGRDLFLYVVQDTSGQIYCINEWFIEGFTDEYEPKFRLPDLNEGDIISLWGFALEITKFEDGFEAPTIVPKIVEKDGEIIYLGDEFQVN